MVGHRPATEETMADDVRLTDGTTIPAGELVIGFARSGGPGGQHVNTSATKVELRFDVAASPSLDDTQKARITAALGTRMTDDGVLVLHASEYRSQARNREAAHARLRNLLSSALRPPRPRRRTRIPNASRRRRLESKRIRSQRKQLRRPPPPNGG
jgi:ribosome-associated protein